MKIFPAVTDVTAEKAPVNCPAGFAFVTLPSPTLAAVVPARIVAVESLSTLLNPTFALVVLILYLQHLLLLHLPKKKLMLNLLRLN
jgi:hypothetical protein